MYFWNVTALKEELKLGPLPQVEAFKHLLANQVLYSMTVSIPEMDNANIYATLAELIPIPILVFGMLYCYRRKGGSRGRGFLARYLGFSLVIGIRWVVWRRCRWWLRGTWLAWQSWERHTGKAATGMCCC